MGKAGMSCVRYLSSFTTQLYNDCRTVAENLVKYVPPDGVFGIQNLQNSISAEGSAPDHAEVAYDAPRLPSQLGGGYPSPFPICSMPSASRCRRLWRGG